ncbi:alpha/beta-hydrolase [Gonapodya prolifera JEL478]|uniref:Alpha/beta-hydrolase n=1 Tax=Gonapodya prolifera (strain JEL478) TaxID=1344416 RepID=A0A139A4R4_GONPJ|nr:alpha/beta-hydrolase [Gonapodya prolifera JEL478]|eukprot:KXS11608.1 alpha/beta-hydrolase [Gonapodya prolifera JEL478]
MSFPRIPLSVPAGYGIPAAAASVTAGLAAFYLFYYYKYPTIKDPELLETNSNLVPIRNGALKLRIVELGDANSEKPTFVFIHGLGGQTTQFASQIAHVSSVLHCPCIAIDNVGHGRSDRPSDYPSYRTTRIVDDALEIVQARAGYRAEQGFVVVGHSYGTVITGLLAVKLDEWKKGSVRAVVLIGPGKPITKEIQSRLSTISFFPTLLIDLWRLWDRRGGANSPSVTRFVASDSPAWVRQRQLEWNAASRTDTLKRVISGMDWAGSNLYERLAGVGCAVTVAVGSDDQVTPKSGAEVVRDVVAGAGGKVGEVVVFEKSGHNSMVDAAAQVNALLEKVLASARKR